MQTGKQERSGCLIAIYSLFAIGVFVLLAGGASVYFFLRSEQGRQILDAAEKGAAWMTTALAAPGTAELREAGCEIALVHTAGAALEVIAPLIPDPEQQQELRDELQSRAGNLDLDALPLVFCTAPRFALRPPSCPSLAVVYGSAVEISAEAFAVIVAQQGQRGVVCQGIYTPTGSLLAPGDGPRTPRMPGATLPAPVVGRERPWARRSRCCGAGRSVGL